MGLALYWRSDRSSRLLMGCFRIFYLQWITLDIPIGFHRQIINPFQQRVVVVEFASQLIRNHFVVNRFIHVRHFPHLFAEHLAKVGNRRLQILKDAHVDEFLANLFPVVGNRQIAWKMIEQPVRIRINVAFHGRELIADINLLAAKPEFASNAATFDEEVHAAHQVEWVSQDREVLIDFRIEIGQPVSAAMIEVAMNALHIRQPITLLVLSVDARQDDVLGLVLIELVIFRAEPMLEQTNHTGTGALWNMRVQDRLGRIVSFHRLKLLVV